MNVVLVFILVFIDQITKLTAVLKLKVNGPIELIENFLQLNIVENRGAAFGILQNKQFLFIIITFIVLIGIIIYIKSNKKLSKITIIVLDLIIAGSIGNLIDRIRLNYVVDFIDVNFWGYYDFPVFNFADSCLVVGTIILAILIIKDKYEVS